MGYPIAIENPILDWDFQNVNGPLKTIFFMGFSTIYFTVYKTQDVISY